MNIYTSKILNPALISSLNALILAMALFSSPANAEVQNPLFEQYQNCIEAQLSSLAAVNEKRESIKQNCASEHANYVAAYPAEVQAFVEQHILRAIEAVLISLEQIEGVVQNSASDVNAINSEMAELEAANNNN